MATQRILDFLATRRPSGPCLVLDLDVVRDNFRAFQKALPNSKIYYAVWTGWRSDISSTRRCCEQEDEITAIDHDDELGVVVVRTAKQTNFEEKLKKKVRTSGCAQGTVFGDLMESLEDRELSRTAVIRTSWLYALMKKINLAPSLYLKAGAIHGCVLAREDSPLVYLEDVGRHNAVDKIAGWMFLNKVGADDKIFYTTGRLTSEMVIKCIGMGIPILASRSGFTAWGVQLAVERNLTLIGRARGRRFLALSGAERIIFDADTGNVAEEDPRHRRKAAEDG